MSNKMLDSSTFGEKLYNTFPEGYKFDDISTNYTLKRYIETCAEGGFKYVIDELNNILTLVDASSIDEELLPILFKNYGLEIFYGVPTLYLRKLLPMIGDLYSRKGSIASVEYITSIVSGVKTIVSLDENYATNRRVNVMLMMDYGMQYSKKFPTKDQLERIITEFLPFYCNVTIIYSFLFIEEAKGLFIGDDTAFDVIRYTNKEGSKPVVIDYSTKTNINLKEQDRLTITDGDIIGIIGNINSLLNMSFYTNRVHSNTYVNKVKHTKDKHTAKLRIKARDILKD